MPEKKVFFVEVPFAGTLSTYVTAESEEFDPEDLE